MDKWLKELNTFTEESRSTAEGTRKQHTLTVLDVLKDVQTKRDSVNDLKNELERRIQELVQSKEAWDQDQNSRKTRLRELDVILRREEDDFLQASVSHQSLSAEVEELREEMQQKQQVQKEEIAELTSGQERLNTKINKIEETISDMKREDAEWKKKYAEDMKKGEIVNQPTAQPEGDKLTGAFLSGNITTRRGTDNGTNAAPGTELPSNRSQGVCFEPSRGSPSHATGRDAGRGTDPQAETSTGTPPSSTKTVRRTHLSMNADPKTTTPLNGTQGGYSSGMNHRTGTTTRAAYSNSTVGLNPDSGAEMGPGTKAPSKSGRGRPRKVANASRSRPDASLGETVTRKRKSTTEEESRGSSMKRSKGVMVIDDDDDEPLPWLIEDVREEGFEAGPVPAEIWDRVREQMKFLDNSGRQWMTAAAQDGSPTCAAAYCRKSTRPAGWNDEEPDLHTCKSCRRHKDVCVAVQNGRMDVLCIQDGVYTER